MNATDDVGHLELKLNLVPALARRLMTLIADARQWAAESGVPPEECSLAVARA